MRQDTQKCNLAQVCMVNDHPKEVPELRGILESKDLAWYWWRRARFEKRARAQWLKVSTDALQKKWWTLQQPPHPTLFLSYANTIISWLTTWTAFLFLLPSLLLLRGSPPFATHLTHSPLVVFQHGKLSANTISSSWVHARPVSWKLLSMFNTIIILSLSLSLLTAQSTWEIGR